MTLKHILAPALVAALALAPAVAAAQAAGSSYISVTQAPSGLIYAPGTAGATLGTVTLAGTRPGTVGLASIPITLTGTNGASAANLSNCALVNGSGTVLNTGSNAFGAMSAGNNTFTFDAPLSITNGSPQTLTLRCTLASGAPSGATYSYTAGTPTLAPSLAATLTAFPSVYPGEVSAPIAAITLNPGASGANLTLTSLPLIASYSGGLGSGYLSGCRLTNASGAVLNANGSGLINAGANTLALDTTMPLTGGGTAVPLILSCNVSSAAPVNGSLALALSPAGIVVANAATGAAVTAMQGYDPTTGAAGTLSGTTLITNPGSTGTGGVIPPDTGAGAGARVAIAALMLASLAALGSWGVFVRSVR